jgi:hypothetical protein
MDFEDLLYEDNSDQEQEDKNLLGPKYLPFQYSMVFRDKDFLVNSYDKEDILVNIQKHLTRNDDYLQFHSRELMSIVNKLRDWAFNLDKLEEVSSSSSSSSSSSFSSLSCSFSSLTMSNSKIVNLSDPKQWCSKAKAEDKEDVKTLSILKICSLTQVISDTSYINDVFNQCCLTIGISLDDYLQFVFEENNNWNYKTLYCELCDLLLGSLMSDMTKRVKCRTKAAIVR